MAQPFPAAVPTYGQNGNYGGTYTGSIPNEGSVQGSALPPPGASPAPVSRRAEASDHRMYGASTAASAPMARTNEANRFPSERPQATGRPIRAEVASAHDLRRPQGLRADRAGGTYTVQSGDTLTNIASRTGVSIDALKGANNLSGSTIRIGQTLTLPNGASATKQVRTAEVMTGSVPKMQQPKPAAAPVQAKPAPVVAAAQKPAPAPVKVAAAEPQPKSYAPPAQDKTDSVAQAQADTKVASIAPESSGVGKLRWPVRGQVVAQYGSRDDGHRNDGIDISVPEGTPVKAAENGVVIYAGNGLKEYGNTVLIRHDDGLVTVYGYAKDLKVQRGDKVTRGQVIADSGMSGEASRPKLHFEVRKDATPVNPMSYLD